MSWLEDLKNRVWLEYRKALREKANLPQVGVPTGSASRGPIRMAGKVLGHPVAQGAIDVGSEVLSGKDPRDAVINVGAGMAASTAASKVLPKSPWIQIPGTIGAYMVGSGTTDWINQNLVKPMFAGQEKEEVAPRVPAATYGPTGAPIGGVGGGNAGPSVQPPLGPAPATQRPVEERHPPVTREVPVSPTPSMNELAQLYARQRILGAEMAKGGELQRRLYEGGVAEGMRTEDFMTWVETHPDLAYRLAEKRGLLSESV